MPPQGGIQCVLGAKPIDCLKQMTSALDSRWIDGALRDSGRQDLRSSKLPAAIVLWLVVAMALFRDRSILEVAALCLLKTCP